MKSKWLSGYILILAAVVLSACSDDSNVEVEESDEASSGSNDLVIATASDIVTLDPHGSNDSVSAQVRENIYEKLVAQDIDGELEPALATEWEQIDDTTWNFKLREDTTFHNGSEFTGEDVKATLERVNDTAVASQSAFLFEMIEDIEVVDGSEVNITTEYPFAPLANHLSHNTGAIISKEIIDEDYQYALDEAGVDLTVDEYYELRESGGEEYEDTAEQIAEYTGTVLGDNTDGTNHLVLESRTSGEEVVTSKFEDFTGGDRDFDTVTFKVIPESGSRIAELQAGGAQVIKDVDSSTASTIEGTDGVDLLETEATRIEYLGFNVEQAPFDDVNVRQAIAHAIDKDEIVSGVYDDMGRAVSNPVPEAIWGYDENTEGIEYDIERAEELLSETDVADGFETTLWVNEDQARIDTAVYIQESLSDIGIDVSIEQFEYGAFLETLANGSHNMFLLGWTTVTGDADNALYALFHSDYQGAGGNRSFYSNDEVDSLLDTGRVATDENERLEAYSEVEQLLIDDAPTVPIINTNFAAGIDNSQIEGIELDAIGSIRFDNVTFK